MKFVKNCVIMIIIVYACVGLSVLLGQSECAGLFGTIIGVGIFAATRKGEQA